MARIGAQVYRGGCKRVLYGCRNVSARCFYEMGQRPDNRPVLMAVGKHT